MNNMASIQIHEDQENRVPPLRQKQLGGMGLKKRPVLGALDKNQPERIIKVKQPLSQVNINGVDEKACNKLASRKAPPPVVPVAQFEAFKVYEDSSEERIERELRERQRRRKDKDQYSNVYKGTEEDRFVTKKEVKEMVAKMQQQAKLAGIIEVTEKVATVPDIETIVGSPMSVGKESPDENQCRDSIAKSKSQKDLFFEMSEYREEIFFYLRQHEKLNRPKPGYMRKQPDITHNMRAILVDWLVEVAEEYKLHTETLYLAVNYIDRFLSYMSVVRAKLQLVGTAAMFIAAKYEEIYPPDVGEFVYITDDTYSKRQVTRMEILILRILDFELSIPTPYTFITAMCISNKLSEKIMFLAMYISELSLLEAEPTLEILSSVMAASSIALARHTLSEDAWTDELSETTRYSLRDLQSTVEFLNVLYTKATAFPQQAIQEKYRAGKYLHVSSILPRDVDIKFE